MSWYDDFIKTYGGRTGGRAGFLRDRGGREGQEPPASRGFVGNVLHGTGQVLGAAGNVVARGLVLPAAELLADDPLITHRLRRLERSKENIYPGDILNIASPLASRMGDSPLTGFAKGTGRFLADVAFDPLTYVTFGGSTLLGKTAARVAAAKAAKIPIAKGSRVAREAARAVGADELTDEILKKFPKPLEGRPLAEQIAGKQRSFASLNVPFTDIDVPLITGKVGEALAKPFTAISRVGLAGRVTDDLRREFGKAYEAGNESVKQALESYSNHVAGTKVLKKKALNVLKAKLTQGLGESFPLIDRTVREIHARQTAGTPARMLRTAVSPFVETFKRAFQSKTGIREFDRMYNKFRNLVKYREQGKITEGLELDKQLDELAKELSTISGRTVTRKQVEALVTAEAEALKPKGRPLGEQVMDLPGETKEELKRRIQHETPITEADIEARLTPSGEVPAGPPGDVLRNVPRPPTPGIGAADQGILDEIGRMIPPEGQPPARGPRGKFYDFERPDTKYAVRNLHDYVRGFREKFSSSLTPEEHAAAKEFLEDLDDEEIMDSFMEGLVNRGQSAEASMKEIVESFLEIMDDAEFTDYFAFLTKLRDDMLLTMHREASEGLLRRADEIGGEFDRIKNAFDHEVKMFIDEFPYIQEDPNFLNSLKKAFSQFWKQYERKGYLEEKDWKILDKLHAEVSDEPLDIFIANLRSLFEGPPSNIVDDLLRQQGQDTAEVDEFLKQFYSKIDAETYGPQPKPGAEGTITVTFEDLKNTPLTPNFLQAIKNVLTDYIRKFGDNPPEPLVNFLDDFTSDLAGKDVDFDATGKSMGDFIEHYAMDLAEYPDLERQLVALVPADKSLTREGIEQLVSPENEVIAAKARLTEAFNRIDTLFDDLQKKKLPKADLELLRQLAKDLPSDLGRIATEKNQFGSGAGLAAEVASVEEYLAFLQQKLGPDSRVFKKLQKALAPPTLKDPYDVKVPEGFKVQFKPFQGAEGTKLVRWIEDARGNVVQGPEDMPDDLLQQWFKQQQETGFYRKNAQGNPEVIPFVPKRPEFTVPFGQTTNPETPTIWEQIKPQARGLGKELVKRLQQLFPKAFPEDWAVDQSRRAFVTKPAKALAGNALGMGSAAFKALITKQLGADPEIALQLISDMAGMSDSGEIKAAFDMLFSGNIDAKKFWRLVLDRDLDDFFDYESSLYPEEFINKLKDQARKEAGPGASEDTVEEIFWDLRDEASHPTPFTKLMEGKPLTPEEEQLIRDYEGSRGMAFGEWTKGSLKHDYTANIGSDWDIRTLNTPDEQLAKQLKENFPTWSDKKINKQVRQIKNQARKYLKESQKQGFAEQHDVKQAKLAEYFLQAIDLGLLPKKLEPEVLADIRGFLSKTGGEGSLKDAFTKEFNRIFNIKVKPPYESWDARKDLAILGSHITGGKELPPKVLNKTIQKLVDFLGEPPESIVQKLEGSYADIDKVYITTADRGLMDARVAEVAKQINEKDARQLEIEMTSGIRIKPLMADNEYLAHVMTPEFRESLVQHLLATGQMPRAYTAKDMSMKLANAARREFTKINKDVIDQWEKGLLVDKATAKKLKSKGGMEVLDQLLDEEKITEEMFASAVHALDIMEVNKIIAAGKWKGNGNVPIAEAFHMNPVYSTTVRGVRGERARTAAEFYEELKTSGIVLPDQQAPNNWLPVRQGELEGFRAPPEIAKAMDGWYRYIHNVHDQNAFLQLFDKTQDWWKAWTLAIFPAYHIRNFVGNMWNNWLAGVDDFRDYKLALEMLHSKQFGQKSFISGLGKEYTTETAVQAAKELGVIDRGFVAQDVGRTIEQQLEKGTWWSPGRNNKLVQGGFKMGTQIENNARMAHFINRLKKGDTPAEAALSVKKYLFDYSELTDFERNVMKRIFPFYAWTRKNVPLQMQHLIMQPAKFSAAFKAQREFENSTPASERYLPEWMSENFPLRIRKTAKGQYEYFLLNNWLPAADLAKLLEIHEMATNMMSPIPKEILQQVFNYDTFLKRKIQAVPGGKTKFLGGEFDSRVVHATKLVRLLNEMDKMTREDVDIMNKISGLLSGKTYLYDQLKGFDTNKYRVDSVIRDLRQALRNEVRKPRPNQREIERLNAMIEEAAKEY